MRKVPILACLVLCTCGGAIAQKVKYKDIYPDLEARKFNKVEPLLTTFLANPKNDDHANAHYQMGQIVEAKFLLHDVLADTAELFQLGTEAITFFDKSKSLIDEKEVKKNEEYYQAFYRRDLRTGDFGIKVSDVHLDIEEKVAALSDRINAIQSLHSSVKQLTDIEAEMTSVFNTLVEGSNSYADYLMGSDLEAISQLGDLQALFRSFDEIATSTVEAGTDLEVEDYFKEVAYVPIEEFSILEPLFPLDNKTIKTYQMGDWASDTKSALNDEIFVLKEDIIEFDRKLKGANARLKNRQPAEFAATVPAEIQQTFQKFDRESVAYRLLKARILENVTLQLSDTAVNKLLLDSAAIAAQVQMSDSILDACKSMQVLLGFEGTQVADANSYYDGFFASSFDGVSGVEKYAKTTANWASKMITKWDTIYNYWYLRNHYGFTETDTISLRPFEESFVEDYLTSGFVDVAQDTIMTWGMKPDTLQGFVAKFGVDRRSIWETSFESPLFAEGDEYDFASDTIAAAEGSITFYVYDQTPSSEQDIAFINVDIETGEVRWVTNAVATRKPQFTVFTPGGKETTIFLYPQEAYPLPNGEAGYLVISNDGELR